MLNVIKSKFKVFIADKLVLYTCFCNLVLCGCMAFFYYDSGNMIEPLIYAIFFLIYPIAVFIFGRNCIPILYLIYVAGATQDTIFINCTCFFIIIFLSWLFPKWKITMLSIYSVEICIVCFRHDRTIFHLLAHIAFCIIFYTLSELAKEAVTKRIYANIVHPTKLELDDKEESIIKQLAEGKSKKEIEGFSKNTVYKYLAIVMERNNCSTEAELIARYSLQNKTELLS